MDDSSFLPKDIIDSLDSEKAFFELERSIYLIERIFTEAFDRQNPDILKEYQNDLYKKLNILHTALNCPDYSMSNDISVEVVSNILLDINDLVGQIDAIGKKKLGKVSLSFSKRFVLGTTRNARRYILRIYNLSSDDIDHIESLGTYFLYDSVGKSIYMFDADVLPVVLKHLLFRGEDVTPIQILKKFEAIIK